MATLNRKERRAQRNESNTIGISITSILWAQLYRLGGSPFWQV